jgi:hypothetical protein
MYSETAHYRNKLDYSAGMNVAVDSAEPVVWYSWGISSWHLAGIHFTHFILIPYF